VARKSGKKTAKRRLVRLSAALVALLGANPALAQTFDCNVGGQLTFGSISTCGASNTITISPANVRSATGCLSVSGPNSRGQCSFTNFAGPQQVVFSVTATQYQITNTTGDKMTVKNFSCKFQPNSAATVTGACQYTGLTNTTFAAVQIDIGATLNVNNPQNAGTYSGIFTFNSSIP